MMIIKKRILKKSPCIPKFVLDNAELNDQKNRTFLGFLWRIRAFFQGFGAAFFARLTHSRSVSHAHSGIKKVAPSSAHAPSALQLKFFKNLLYDNYIIN